MPLFVRAIVLYRHNGHYYNYMYSTWDKRHHMHLLDILHGESVDPKEFQKTLAATRKSISKEADAYFDKPPPSKRPRKQRAEGEAPPIRVLEGIYHEPPCRDARIKYYYQVDLDQLIFSFRGCRLYRLDHMPPVKVAVEGIGRDYYSGHACLLDSVPAQYRWDFKLRAARILPCFIPRSSSVPPLELLGLSSDVSHTEKTRIDVYAMLVGCLMCTQARILHEIRASSYSNDGDDYHVALAHFLISRVLTPVLASPPGDEEIDRRLAWWPRQHIFVQITRSFENLDLPSAVSQVTANINRNCKASGVVFGVLFSVSHIVFVRVDKSRGEDCTHTRVQPFLPSFRASEPYTEGITALVRLSLLPGPDDRRFFKALICDVVSELSTPEFTTRLARSDSRFAINHLFKLQKPRLPAEVMRKIAEHVTGVETLGRLASTSLEALDNIIPALKLPMIGRTTASWLFRVRSREPVLVWDEDAMPSNIHLYSASLKVHVRGEEVNMVVTASEKYAHFVHDKFAGKLVWVGRHLQRQDEIEVDFLAHRIAGLANSDLVRIFYVVYRN